MLLKPSLGIFITLIPAFAFANDFPTQARVEFVLGCMDRQGGQSYENMYGCVCAIDKIASMMSHERYVQADTLAVMIETPGERGGAFRDAPGARGLVREYKATLKSAEEKCFVKAVVPPSAAKN
ncbi:MAG: hypothetical protein ACFCUJ_16590 [Thiotrichales bacterium]